MQETVQTNNRNKRLEDLFSGFDVSITRHQTTVKNSSQIDIDIQQLIKEIPISEIVDFPGHPFQVRENQEMMDMAESIQRHGVINPAIVRPVDGKYELVSGHRRKRACELLGIDRLPCVVRELTRDEACLAMVDSNLQRENILPSERAFSYKMKLNAIKRQGKRTDLTSPQLGTKLRADETVADNTGDSRNQVHRYIRLTELIPEILQMVDERKMAFSPAVEISYMSKELQRELLSEMQLCQATPSHAQARRLKQFAREGKLDRYGIAIIMSEEKPQQREVIKLSPQMNRYFGKGSTPKQREEHVLKALEHYDKHLRRKAPEG